jgi:hypothetical protein
VIQVDIGPFERPQPVERRVDLGGGRHIKYRLQCSWTDRALVKRAIQGRATLISLAQRAIEKAPAHLHGSSSIAETRRATCWQTSCTQLQLSSL